MNKKWISNSTILLFLTFSACGSADAEDGEGTESADTSADTETSASTSADAETSAETTAETTGGTTGGEEPDEVAGCEGASLYERPADPAAPGPWPVGAKTVTVNGFNVEVWYPAEFGSDAGVEPKVYDIREQLPPSQMGIIPDEDNPWQPCDCSSDLPLDSAHGPYPLVVFVHGTAGWRTQSLSQMTHWASRGFVVAAADYEGLKLGHILANLCPDSGGTQNLSADTDAVIAAVTGAGGDLAFLSGAVDATRVAVAGHSAGGGAAASSSNKAGVRVVIPMAAGSSVSASATLESVLLMGGDADSVVSYSSTQGAYDGSVSPKRLVGLSNAGHLAFSDLCAMKNTNGENLLQIANEYGICGAQAAGFLFDCSETLLGTEMARPIVNYATTVVLEDVLQCRDDGADLSMIESVYADVSEYREAL